MTAGRAGTTVTRRNPLRRQSVQSVRRPLRLASPIGRTNQHHRISQLCVITGTGRRRGRPALPAGGCDLRRRSNDPPPPAGRPYWSERTAGHLPPAEKSPALFLHGRRPRQVRQRPRNGGVTDCRKGSERGVMEVPQRIGLIGS